MATNQHNADSMEAGSNAAATDPVDEEAPIPPQNDSEDEESIWWSGEVLQIP